MLVQGVVDYAIYLLDPSGIVTNWNAGAERIKGYRPGEVIGTHFSRFYLEADRERGEPARALQTAEREGRFESEGWRVRKDGSPFWANVVVDPIRDDAGVLLGFAKVTRDVTLKRQAEQALEQAREALFHAQKLDAIGQLTGGVAHDFNNLLTVILSSLELVSRRLPDDPKLVRLVQNAVKGAKRGVSLVQRMLAFARRQELRPEAVDVAVLVQEMLDMLARTLGSTVRITTDFSLAPSPVLVDANQLELAMLNLAVNARDAMPGGGELVISARNETVAAGHPKLAPRDYVRLTIKDCGSGMSPETLLRATEPFFTTKGTGKGTGLGLPMVHGLAAQSGGQFVLESTEGVGTTAELWLPAARLADVPVAATEAAPAERAGFDAQPLVVLAVDDDSLVLAGTVDMLEDLGHTPLPASSALEALEIIRTNVLVSLVLTDQAMPVMTGAQLIEILRSERPDLPVVLTTGYGEIPATLKPTTHKLAKPFTQDELSAALGNAAALAKARGRHGN
jgi:PAS domain S-box-containing protein